MLELGHCCSIYLVIVWLVSWHHHLSGIGKKGTFLLALAPLESRLVQDLDCPILLEIAKYVHQVCQWVRVEVLLLLCFDEWFNDFEECLLISSTFLNFSRMILRLCLVNGGSVSIVHHSIFLSACYIFIGSPLCCKQPLLFYPSFCHVWDLWFHCCTNA